MRILSLKDPEELADQTEALLRSMLTQKKQPLRGFLPAGNSAQGLFKKMIQKRDQWQGQIEFLQVDEFVGGSEFFLRGLREQILKPLDLEKKAETIDNTWSEAQFQAHIQNVLKRPIDFAVLGLGPNGHVGFHEPGPHGLEYLGGITQLTQESYERVVGAPSQKALTFGAGSFYKAKHVLLLATGNGKEKIFSRFLETEPTSELPASLLKTHPQFTVLSTLGK